MIKTTEKMPEKILLVLLLSLIAATTQQPTKWSSKKALLLPALPPRLRLPKFQHYSKDHRTTVSHAVKSLRDPTSMENHINADFFKSKFKSLAEFADFKLRLLKFLGGLVTQENFYLLRRFLVYLSKVSIFVSDFLPQQPEGSTQIEFPQLPETPTEDKMQMTTTERAPGFTTITQHPLKQVQIEPIANPNPGVQLKVKQTKVTETEKTAITNHDGNAVGLNKGNDASQGQEQVAVKLVDRYLDSLNLWRNQLDEDYDKLW